MCVLGTWHFLNMCIIQNRLVKRNKNCRMLKLGGGLIKRAPQCEFTNPYCKHFHLFTFQQPKPCLYRQPISTMIPMPLPPSSFLRREALCLPPTKHSLNVSGLPRASPSSNHPSLPMTNVRSRTTFFWHLRHLDAWMRRSTIMIVQCWTQDYQPVFIIVQNQRQRWNKLWSK